MMVRIAVLFCCVAAAAPAAVPAARSQQAHEEVQPAAYVAIQPAQPVNLVPAAKLVYAEQESPAQYEYEYLVKDPHTGDDKQMKENRSGGEVRGFYSFVQPDGVRRIVEYSSSKEQGFNAVVRYEGRPTPVPARVAYAPAPASNAAVVYAQPQAAIDYAQRPDPQITYAPAPAAQVYYAPSQPAPFTLNSVHAEPVTYIQAQIAYNPTAADQVTYGGVPSPVAYAPAPSPIRYAIQSQPAVKVALAQRIAYAAGPTAGIAYTQANAAYAAQPQLVRTQAHEAQSAPLPYVQAPVAYGQTPLAKIS